MYIYIQKYTDATPIFTTKTSISDIFILKTITLSSCIPFAEIPLFFSFQSHSASYKFCFYFRHLKVPAIGVGGREQCAMVVEATTALTSQR